MLNTDNRKNIFRITSIFFVIAIILASIYFIFFANNNLENELKTTGTEETPFEKLQSLEIYKKTEALLKENNSEQAHFEFSNYLKQESMSGNQNLSEAAVLYSVSLLRKHDRDRSYREYYNFFRDENNSNLNRSYAATMAIQQALANGEFKKLLIFLSEDDVRNLKEITSKEVVYLLSERIFALDPFPLTAVRLSNYEVRQEVNVGRKLEIYNKYLYNLYSRLGDLDKDPGLRHLNANTLLNLGQLQSHLEDFKVVNATTTTKTFEDAYNYALLYSPKLTQEYILLAILEHSVKHKNLNREEKVLKVFADAKTVSVIIQNTIKDENVLKRDYPSVFSKINSDSTFKDKLFKAVKI